MTSFSARGGHAPRDPKSERGLVATPEDLLRRNGIDPDAFDGTNAWIKTPEFSLHFRPKGPAAPDAQPLTEEQLDRILGEPLPLPAPPAEETILVVPQGDQQIGKIDGDGTSGTVARYKRCIAQVRDRIIQDHGGVVHTLVLPQLGDTIEGCVSQGGRLATRLDTPVSMQVTVAHRLLLDTIKDLAQHAYQIVVPVVGGNHDETTRQYATDPTDSWALTAARAAMDSLVFHGGFEHVEFVFPEKGHRALGFEVGDRHTIKIGITHGDVKNRAESLIPDYYLGQLANDNSPLTGARILINGHFHHFRAQPFLNDKYWIQTPALDGGSEWFREISRTADDLTSGMISFLATPTKRVPIDRIGFHE